MLSEKARKFLSKSPTLIGRVMGCAFYEHPTRGDESPLVMIDRDGVISVSSFWELPMVEDLIAA